MVQEIAELAGEEIPEKFLYKDGFNVEAIYDLDLWKDNLLIDFSLLDSDSPAAGKELAKLRSALSEWGCCQVVNHGIENSFLEELIQVGNQFFDLPIEEKLKYSITSENRFQGYDSGLQSNGPQVVNWNDGLYLTLHPEEKRNLQVFPDKPERLSGMMDECTKKVVPLTEAMYKAMARSLDLPEDSFLRTLGKGMIIARYNCYPPCPCPDRVLGFREHPNPNPMTMVLQEEEVQGLEVEKGGRWYKVPTIPGAFFVIFGNMGKVMTNGIFKSVVHRTVTNSEKQRLSLSVISLPENPRGIRPASEKSP